MIIYTTIVHIDDDVLEA